MTKDTLYQQCLRASVLPDFHDEDWDRGCCSTSCSMCLFFMARCWNKSLEVVGIYPVATYSLQICRADVIASKIVTVAFTLFIFTYVVYFVCLFVIFYDMCKWTLFVAKNAKQLPRKTWT